MKIKQLTLDAVFWTIEAEQDEVPVRGNAMVSGDDDDDKRVEDEITRRLDNGDIWAWAAVTVKGCYKGLEAHDSLGCCSYKNEEDFKRPGDYYDDMRQIVLDDLQKQLEDLVNSSLEEPVYD